MLYGYNSTTASLKYQIQEWKFKVSPDTYYKSNRKYAKGNLKKKKNRRNLEEFKNLLWEQNNLPGKTLQKKE